MLDEEAIRQDERRRCADRCQRLADETNELWKAAVLAGDLDKARRLDGETAGATVAAARLRKWERTG